MADDATFNAAIADKPGQQTVNGKVYMPKADGSLMPIEMVKPLDLLMDEATRKIMAFAEDISAQVSRFRAHTLADIYDFMAVCDQEHGVKVAGQKGNLSLFTYDGLMMVKLAVAKREFFGPELQSAKVKVDECLTRWADNSGPEIRAIVQHAFKVDEEGKVSPSLLYSLMNYNITDPDWLEAMAAIRASIRPMGTKEYVRFYTRPDIRSAWKPVKVDLAAA